MEGQSVQSVFPENNVPANFWDLPPQEAALAFAQANQTSQREPWECVLAINPPKGKSPPERTAIRYRIRTNGCSLSHTGDTFFLWADPQGSYLAYCSEWETWEGGSPGQWDANNLRMVELKYDEARQIARVIWWMQYIDSSNRGPVADEPRELHASSPSPPVSELVLGESKNIKIEGDTWGPIAESWKGPYCDLVMLNLAGYLLRDYLPKHLGDRWTGQEPLEWKKQWQGISESTDPALSAKRKELKDRQAGLSRDAVRKMLERLSDKPLAYPLIEAAAQVAGENGFSEFKSSLLSLGSKVKSSRIDLAVKQIDGFNDPVKLRELAISTSGADQAAALNRLRGFGEKQYLDALEELFFRSQPGKAWEILQQIERIDPERVQSMSRKVPPAMWAEMAKKPR